jgi:hypothetical protein
MHEANFSVIKGTKDGLPGIILVDVALDPPTQAPRYPWLVKITLAMRELTPQGLCSPEESARLDWLEDDLLDSLDESEYLYAGRVTWNGAREIHLYVASPEPVLEKLAAQLQAPEMKSVSISYYRDPHWDEYRALLP